MDHRSIFRSAGVISSMTVVSRLTGFVRDVLMASVFGTGAAAQAFFVAFKVPNMFRDVMGEGAGNAAFVPVFCEYLEKRPRPEFFGLVNRLFFLVCVASGVIVLGGIVFAPVVIRCVAPGFIADPEKFALTVALNRIVFGYLLFVTVSAFFMALLNSLKSFGVPAATSIVFNLVSIVGLWTMVRTGTANVFLLALLVLVGGGLQIVMQLPSLRARGFRWDPGAWSFASWRDPGVRRVGRLMAPRLLGTSIYQINIFVDTIVASIAAFTGEGAIAAIYYANRIVQFPLSIFGVALANASLPSLSGSWARKDVEAIGRTLSFCLRCAFLGLIPLTVGLVFLSRPLVAVVFERGSFDARATEMTAAAVAFYSLGLFSYASVRLLSHVFYALQDTRTPVKTAVVSCIVNVVLIGVFVFVLRMGVAGLALASSISATANAVFLGRALCRRVPLGAVEVLGRVSMPVFVAAAASAAVMSVFWSEVGLLSQGAVKLIVAVALGAVVYVGGLSAFRVAELRDLIRWVWPKR